MHARLDGARTPGDAQSRPRSGHKGDAVARGTKDPPYYDMSVDGQVWRHGRAEHASVRARRARLSASHPSANSFIEQFDVCCETSTTAGRITVARRTGMALGVFHDWYSGLLVSQRHGVRQRTLAPVARRGVALAGTRSARTERSAAWPVSVKADLGPSRSADPTKRRARWRYATRRAPTGCAGHAPSARGRSPTPPPMRRDPPTSGRGRCAAREYWRRALSGGRDRPG